MNNKKQEQNTLTSLSEILIPPSNQLLVDRFSSTSAAPCRGSCSGECQSA